MVAYTGAPVDSIFGPVVVDLAGMDIGGQRKPILRQHDPDQIAGYSESVSVGPDGITMTGTLSNRTPAGQEVAALADEGFPWQASIGFRVLDYDELGKNDVRNVNGAEFKGPGMIVTKAKLKESSFVPLGADSETSAAVFDDADSIKAGISTKESNMDTPKTPDPAALADAEKEGFNKAKAELSAMLAAFPTDQAYALAAFAKGQSITEAKAEWADLLNAKLAEQAKQLADAQSKLAAVQTAGQAPLPLAAPTIEAKPEEPKPLTWKEQGFTSEKAFELYQKNLERGNVHVLKGTYTPVVA